MVFSDNKITLTFDDSIIIEGAVKPETLHVKHGDVFVINITEDNKIVLKKQNG